MRNKNQNIILAKGDRGNLIIRGLDLNKAMATTYGEYYLGNIHSTQELDGKTALAYAIFNTKVLDVDASCIL
jgi:hypothetical protein